MKRILCLVLVVIMLSSVLTSCGAKTTTDQESAKSSATSEIIEKDEPEPVIEEEPFDIDGYKGKVAALKEDIEYAGIAFANMGNYLNKYMEILGRTSDTQVDKAFEWLEEKSDYTKDGLLDIDEQIQAEFSDIVLMTKGDTAEIIFNPLNDLMVSYNTIYCIVTTIPLSISQFTTDLNISITDFNTATKMLDSVLG